MQRQTQTQQKPVRKQEQKFVPKTAQKPVQKQKREYPLVKLEYKSLVTIHLKKLIRGNVEMLMQLKPESPERINVSKELLDEYIELETPTPLQTVEARFAVGILWYMKDPSVKDLGHLAKEEVDQFHKAYPYAGISLEQE